MAEEDKLTDDETELLHCAHIGFNALARMYFILKEQEIIQDNSITRGEQ